MSKRDVSDLCRFQNPDDEALPLTQCVCGVKYQPWDVILSIYEDAPREMPCCGRRLVFANKVRVYEIDPGDRT